MRVRELATCQLRLLTHAMRFVHVPAVVYSTCSVRDEENERVVAAALGATAGWRLHPALPEWPRRGRECGGALVAHEARACARFCSREDRTSGFFIAPLVRAERGATALATGTASSSCADALNKMETHTPRQPISAVLPKTPHDTHTKVEKQVSLVYHKLRAHCLLPSVAIYRLQLL